MRSRGLPLDLSLRPSLVDHQLCSANPLNGKVHTRIHIVIHLEVNFVAGVPVKTAANSLLLQVKAKDETGLVTKTCDTIQVFYCRWIS